MVPCQASHYWPGEAEERESGAGLSPLGRGVGHAGRPRRLGPGGGRGRGSTAGRTVASPTHRPAASPARAIGRRVTAEDMGGVHHLVVSKWPTPGGRREKRVREGAMSASKRCCSPVLLRGSRQVGIPNHRGRGREGPEQVGPPATGCRLTKAGVGRASLHVPIPSCERPPSPGGPVGRQGCLARVGSKGRRAGSQGGL